MIKSSESSGKASVTFTLHPAVGASRAAVCGDWNDWSGDAHVMQRDGDGGFKLTVTLGTGRAYRFRYLLDGHRWENDWDADAYVANDFGSEDSVVDLTSVATPAAAAPAAPKKAGPGAPAKKAPAAPKTPKKAAN